MKIFALLLSFALLSSPAMAGMEDQPLPRLMTYEEIMDLPAASREAYLQGIREILRELAEMPASEKNGLFTDASSNLKSYASLLERFLPSASAEEGINGMRFTREEQRLMEARRELEMAQVEANRYGLIGRLFNSGYKTAEARVTRAKEALKVAQSEFDLARVQAPKQLAAAQTARTAQAYKSALDHKNDRLPPVREDEKTPPQPAAAPTAAEVTEAKKQVTQMRAAEAEALKRAREAKTPEERSQALAGATLAQSNGGDARDVLERAKNQGRPERVDQAQRDYLAAKKKAEVAQAEADKVRQTETRNLDRAKAKEQQVREKAESDAKAKAEAEAKAQSEITHMPDGMSTGITPSATAGSVDACPQVKLECKDVGEITDEKAKSDLRGRFYAKKQKSDAVKACNIGGNWSQYRGGKRAPGNCSAVFEFCFAPGRCQIKEGKPLRCREKGTGLCNPMYYGVQADGSPICVAAKSDMSKRCEEAFPADKRLHDFLNLEQPGIREKWNREIDNFQKVCGSGISDATDRADVQTVNCSACRFMAKKIANLNHRITKKCELGPIPEVKGPASPARGSKPARQTR